LFESETDNEELIHDYATYKLPGLDYKLFFVQTWVLVSTILINIGWIVWLVIAYTRPRWHGSQFILGGIFLGYVATVTKFLITQQVFSVGKIMPYRNMLPATGKNVESTIASDYWPYEWPIVRFRAFLNRDYFFQLIDIVEFLFTEAIVQFESNILSAKYDCSQSDLPGGPPLLGYAPNRGVIIIATTCHGAVVITTLAILIWPQLKETGLLADPGYLALYLAMFSKDDIQDDFQGFKDEDRPWIVRQRLEQNQYRIGYWRRGDHAVYGIRRTKILGNDGETDPPRPRRSTEYPEFRYIPWI